MQVQKRIASEDPRRDPGTAALVLSGGGARGAYQVGVLKALAEAMPGPLPFPVVTGVSVGAINAVVIAAGADDFGAATDKLEELWRGLRCSSVYRTDFLTMLQRFAGFGTAFALPFLPLEAPRSLLDASPLAYLLAREVAFDRISAMVEEGCLKALAVTASSYASGNSVTFYEGREEIMPWTRSRREGKREPIGADHVLASAALPGVFEARRVGPSWYGDGALRQAAPLSPAIHLGSDRLFLIAARDGSADPEPGVVQPYPSLGFIAGQLLDIVFNDHLDADRERLERINQTVEAMNENRRAQVPLKPIETTMVRPSRDIRQIAAQHWHEAPLAVRLLLQAVGASSSDGLLPSYLTFEPGYVGALIDLGYEDARADIRRLVDFVEGRTPDALVS